MIEWIRKRFGRISVESVKMELLRTAYGNRHTLSARIDPRALMAWYLAYALLPWFFFNRAILLGMLLVTVVMAFISRVSKLIVFLLVFGVVSQLLGYGIFALFMGASFDVFWSLSTLIMKLLTISVASIAVFASMDPEQFSDALVSLGLNGKIAFGVSYGYRIIPVLLQEYGNIVNSYRLRSKAPARGFLFGLRYLWYLGGLAVRSFYPMMLNTAMRTRTTVEGLEVKGFTYALENPKAKELRLAHLKIDRTDVGFLVGNAVILAAVIAAGSRIPL